ncbi:MAG TPA: glycosyltransferase family 4 protein [Candidatus Limnocylindrales bacterium]|nr:glycosyltransferase family 4 protein [Candidatus Limnocylindrales bacterium]
MEKKLCHVFFDEFPKDSRIRRYTNTLLAHEFKVFIVCIKGDSKKILEHNGNINIYRVPLRKKRSSFMRRLWEYFLFEVFSFLIVSYLCLRHRIRLFHVHTLPDFLVFTCWIPKILGSKIILDFHELFPEFMCQHKPSTQNSFIMKILYFQEKASFGFADEVIVFHDLARGILENRVKIKKNITVVMNGVDPSELPLIQREKTDKFNIVYNGTINFNLNLSLIVKALEIIKRKYPEIYSKIEFHLYGDGPDLENILNLANKLAIHNVRYQGRLRFKEMMERLSTASVCILPPKKDIYSDLYYSLKLTEMIYLKIPVIATKLKTYLYYFPEDCVIYFDSDDADQLAEKIVFVYRYPSEVRKFTENAFNRYQAYKWEIMRARYIKLINSLICQ